MIGTRRQATTEANRRWATAVDTEPRRTGYASRARTRPLYRVGYIEQSGGPLGPAQGVCMGASDRGWEAAFAEADRYAERRARIEQVAEFARHLGRLDVRIDLLVDSDRRRALEAEREDQIIAIDAAIARALEP